jgi:hypothetical protein
MAIYRQLTDSFRFADKPEVDTLPYLHSYNWRLPVAGAKFTRPDS